MKVIETGIDEIMEHLQEKGSTTVEDFAEEFGYPSEVVEEWVKALEDHGAVEIDYGLTSTEIILVEEERGEGKEEGAKEKAKKKLKEEKDKENVCGECGKSFETEHGLKIHKSMMHKEGD